MRKKRFIDKYRNYWHHSYTTLEGAGCTNPFDKTAVFALGTLYNLTRVFGYIFLACLAMIWVPIYVLYCWITERRYRND